MVQPRTVNGGKALPGLPVFYVVGGDFRNLVLIQQLLNLVRRDIEELRRTLTPPVVK